MATCPGQRTLEAARGNGYAPVRGSPAIAIMYAERAVALMLRQVICLSVCDVHRSLVHVCCSGEVLKTQERLQMLVTFLYRYKWNLNNCL